MNTELLIQDFEKRGYSVEIIKGLKARLSCKHCNNEMMTTKLWIPNMECYMTDKYLDLTDKITNIVNGPFPEKRTALSKEEIEKVKKFINDYPSDMIDPSLVRDKIREIINEPVVKTKKVLTKEEEFIVATLKSERTEERLKQVEIFNREYLQISEKMPWPDDFSESEASYKCDFCISKRGLFKSEHNVRQAFQEIFKAKFNKVRPSWLLGCYKIPLELDGFNEELKIAFEHNGMQHYKFTPRFHSSKKDFNEMKKRDKLKTKICAGKGIKLYIIPQAPSSGVLEYVKKCIEEQS